MAAARQVMVRVPELAGKTLGASEILTAPLCEESLHGVLRHRHRWTPGLLPSQLTHLRRQLATGMERALRGFVVEFPPAPAYPVEISAEAYLPGSSDGIPHHGAAIERTLLLSMANSNPAPDAHKKFFEDGLLADSACAHRIALVESYLASGETLLYPRHATARAWPYSIEGQLRFVFGRWSAVLDTALLEMACGLRNMLARRQQPEALK
ncbi:MAG TPA: hypothetical protein VLL49_08140 [Anaerolineales bacterium]|nr:hypothetical protein [Anaerolineales bacterium]